MGPKSKKSEKRKEKEETARRASLLLFSKYYIAQYGQERWEELLNSLSKPVRYCALINKWADNEFARELLGINIGDSIQLLEDYPYAYVKLHQHEQFMEDQLHQPDHDNKPSRHTVGESQLDDDGELNIDHLSDNNILTHRWPAPGIPSSLDRNGLCCYYPMDGASLLPVIALNLNPNSRVYDMCAAPGGKSLIISSYFTESGTGSLTCSDISPSRRLRLHNTLRRYLPAELYSRVNILAGDATSKQFHSDNNLISQFDRILVDAPCSSERHVLHSSDELSRWSSGRSKLNSERQYNLLYNALKICSIHGRVVYSTCSLSHLENDDVITKVVNKINKKFHESVVNSIHSSSSSSSSFSPASRSSSSSPSSLKIPYVQICQINSSHMPFGEPTEHGWHILPDRSDGWGPIYFAVMEIHYKEVERQNNVNSTPEKKSKRKDKSTSKGDKINTNNTSTNTSTHNNTNEEEQEEEGGEREGVNQQVVNEMKLEDIEDLNPGNDN